MERLTGRWRLHRQPETGMHSRNRGERSEKKRRIKSKQFHAVVVLYDVLFFTGKSRGSPCVPVL